MNKILKFFVSIFLFLFVSIFLLTILTPASIEKSAESFIKKEIESDVKELILKEKISDVTNKAFDFGKKIGLKTNHEKWIKLLTPKLPVLIEFVVDYKLEQRENAQFKKLSETSKKYLSKFTIGDKKLEQLIEEKYKEIKRKLKADIRVYAGINAFLMLLLLFFYTFKKEAEKELLLPSFLLLTSTIISSLIYVFGQDWIYIMLYNKYLGFSYIIYVLIIFAMLLDIAYNGGRITLKILELIIDILNAIIKLLEGILQGL